MRAITRWLRTDGVGEVDVLAIYQIENGKIAKAWFKMGSPRLTGEVDSSTDGLSDGGKSNSGPRQPPD
jgi:hypothetical protein